MVMGRIVYSIVHLFVARLNGNAYLFEPFIGVTLLSSIPRIILQLILIPIILVGLKRAGQTHLE